MDSTRTFLLNEMAGATNLQDFYLAYRALLNLNMLAAQMNGQAGQLGQFNQPMQPNPSVQPQAPIYGQSLRQQQPQRPQPYNPASEPSWGEDDERMPWEQQ